MVVNHETENERKYVMYAFSSIIQGKRMNDILAIVVTYNRKELLKKCIDHLLDQTIKDLDILIVDNASTDGTGEFVQGLYSKEERVIYENTGSNLGGAGGFSYGIRWAVVHKYEYLWIMDDDTIPVSNALEKLKRISDLLNGKYGFLSSYAKWIDESPCEMNVPELALEWRNNIAFQFENRMIRINAASFVSLFVKTSVVKEIGLPIKEFFIWADDLEYTKRISRKYPGYFVYDSQVVHEMKSNEATDIYEADASRLDRYKYLYRNRYYVAKKESKRSKLLFWMWIKNTLRDIMRAKCTQKSKRCMIVIKSCIEGLKFNPSIEYVD